MLCSFSILLQLKYLWGIVVGCFTFLLFVCNVQCSWACGHPSKNGTGSCRTVVMTSLWFVLLVCVAGNLPFDSTEEDIRSHFGKVGKSLHSFFVPAACISKESSCTVIMLLLFQHNDMTIIPCRLSRCHVTVVGTHVCDVLGCSMQRALSVFVCFRNGLARPKGVDSWSLRPQKLSGYVLLVLSILLW